MVHPGGFEPPTARFVAEYSIQLSYGCIGKTLFTTQIQCRVYHNHTEQDGASGRIRTSDRSVRSRVLYPAELRMHRENLLYNADSVSHYLATLSKMVHPGGFEPPTARFVAEYSIQLSYGCKMAVRRGFEPRMQLLTAYSLSRGAPSASRPPHHTPLTSASKSSLRAHRRCVAHILLSGTYKSNNFSQP